MNQRLAHGNHPTQAQNHPRSRVKQAQVGKLGLIVETENLEAGIFDDRGVHPSSEISVIERFTLSEDESRLDYRVTITDPATFTGSFDLTRYWVWRPEIPLGSWRCGESQDVPGATL